MMRFLAYNTAFKKYCKYIFYFKHNISMKAEKYKSPPIVIFLNNHSEKLL